MNYSQEVRSTGGADAAGQIMTWIEATARGMIDATEVSVTCSRERDTLMVSLMVPTSEVGKIIGKQGRTARALRTLIGCMAMKRGLRVNLDIHEPGREAEAASAPGAGLKHESSLPSYHQRGSAY